MTEDLEFALLRLAEERRPIHTLNLAPLSDMSRGHLPQFRETWSVLGGQRRLALVHALVEQAEANVQLNFWTVLRSLLGDQDPNVRKLAIEGLWEDNRTTLIAPLTAMLDTDPSPDVRAAAAVSLGRFVLLGELGEIGEGPALEAFGSLRNAWFRLIEVTEVRRRALEGLSNSSANVHELIETAYYDDDPAMRHSAVFAMGRTGDRRWSRLVLQELGSVDAAMRFEAATAAGELALISAVQPLIRLLDDVDSNVREAAALSLGQIGGPEARRALQACAASDDERLAEAAQDALEELAFNSGTASAPLFDFANPAGGPLGDDDDDLSDGDEYESEFGYELYEDDEAALYDDAGEDDDESDWDDDESEADWD